MAAIAVTNKPVRYVVGPLVIHRYTSTAVANGATLTIPGISNIEIVLITPSTATYGGYYPAATWSGNVITFASSNAWGGTILVISRTG